ncbi:Spliceosome-associated protein-like protein [Hapsidospora chrysogenum ATCC 11550]|uniref:Spliceosome-associated protein-like protein n=1 Tax=Hapsidospora chrysogenum (strain ATCC 11550 / CBS 779.69 / DSM 880 / IAM 14645 / JCM 23072 / IMI 49137) TaxID=857340 RepID=A0A086TDY8_HAPC1|nr:Spliceosome-associated protein-like protein [Hapsidospora chrysogenum ATCC 11550]
MAQNRHWEQDKDATVYIGNIDERATPAMVYEIMLQMGPIHNIHMPRDRVTQTHQGFGFVEFRTPADAEYAANVMNGVKLYGKSLRVNKASADKQKGADVGAELFVGNLDPMVDEKILYDTFSRFGPLLSLPKVAREESGASKGFGFVSFGDFESSDAAIANLHGQYILSKEVSVQYAFKKDGRGERHGDEAERELAAQAKKRNLVPEAQPVPQAFLNPPKPQAPVAPPTPVGFDHSSSMPPVGMPPVAGVPPPHAPPAGFAPPPRGPSPYNAGPPPPVVPGRGPVPLPPAPSGLPARPPQGQPGGYPNPADFHPGHGGFRPPSGSPTPPGFPVAPPPGFAPPPGASPTPPPGFAPPGATGTPPAPPGFVPPGATGTPPAPPGFAPPPGFQPPPGFGRR